MESAPVATSIVIKRATLAAATALLTVNIWTGAPLIALWVGSKAVGQQTLSMAAVGLVVLVLAVLLCGLVLALSWLNNTYDELIGRPRTERRAAWMRSMRGESEGHISQRVGVTTLERIIVLNVYVAFTALAVWYVFLAGPPSALI